MKKNVQNLDFHLDSNGTVSYSKWTAGITILAQAKIVQPKGNNHMGLLVNNSRKLSANIVEGQEISAKIKTTFFNQLI